MSIYMALCDLCCVNACQRYFWLRCSVPSQANLHVPWHIQPRKNLSVLRNEWNRVCYSFGLSRNNFGFKCTQHAEHNIWCSDLAIHTHIICNRDWAALLFFSENIYMVYMLELGHIWVFACIRSIGSQRMSLRKLSRFQLHCECTMFSTSMQEDNTNEIEFWLRVFHQNLYTLAKRFIHVELRHIHAPLFWYGHHELEYFWCCRIFLVIKNDPILDKPS